jgi:branched-chain amino acid transport system permease protein
MDLVESYSEELRLVRKPWTRIWVLAIVIACLLLPVYGPDYVVHLATLVCIYAVGVMGQNILIGYTGQISLGQAGFLAIGAFTFGHLSQVGVPWPLALLGAGIAAGLFGILVGFPSLRLKGPYLAIVTMGFGIAVHQIFANFEVLSGGRMGMAIPRLEPLFGLSRTDFNFYFNILILLVFTVLTYNIVSSYMGRAFIAIRDNDIAAEVIGVNLTRYKLLSFAVSSFYTGVHGGLYALFLGHVEPNMPMFTFMGSVYMFVAVIIGGLAFVEGSIMGAAFVILVPHIPFVASFEGLTPVIFGITILIVLIFEPLGLAGRWFKLRLYFRNWPLR